MVSARPARQTAVGLVGGERTMTNRNVIVILSEAKNDKGPTSSYLSIHIIIST